MQTESSIEIEGPIQDVFDYTNDHVTEWSRTCVEEELVEEQPGHVGTTLRIVTVDRGKRMEFAGEVVRWDPPSASAVAMHGKSFDIVAAYAFEDLGGGRTRVTQRATVSGKGLTRLMLVLFGWMGKAAGCKAQQAELESLRRHFESKARAATPPRRRG